MSKSVGTGHKSYKKEFTGPRFYEVWETQYNSINDFNFVSTVPQIFL